MRKQLRIFIGTLRSSVCNRRELVFENVELRQQLAGLKYEYLLVVDLRQPAIDQIDEDSMALYQLASLRNAI